MENLATVYAQGVRSLTDSSQQANANSIAEPRRWRGTCLAPHSQGAWLEEDTRVYLRSVLETDDQPGGLVEGSQGVAAPAFALRATTRQAAETPGMGQ